MKIVNTEKNPNTGKLEATITLTELEAENINECIRLVIDRKLGDSDDPERNKVMSDLKEGFHQAVRLVNPS